jgi:hypothetical protein
VIFHGASAIGGTVPADGKLVSVEMNWTERFDGGAWQSLRDKDVIVFLQAGGAVHRDRGHGTEHGRDGRGRPADLTRGRGPGLAAQLMEETRTRQVGIAAAR